MLFDDWEFVETFSAQVCCLCSSPSYLVFPAEREQVSFLRLCFVLPGHCRNLRDLNPFLLIHTHTKKIGLCLLIETSLSKHKHTRDLLTETFVGDCRAADLADCEYWLEKMTHLLIPFKPFFFFCTMHMWWICQGRSWISMNKKADKCQRKVARLTNDPAGWLTHRQKNKEVSNLTGEGRQSLGGARIQMETRWLSVSRIHTEVKRRPVLYDLELPELVERKPWLNSGCEHQSCGLTEQFPVRLLETTVQITVSNIHTAISELHLWPLTDHRPSGRHPEETMVPQARSALKAKCELH